MCLGSQTDDRRTPLGAENILSSILAPTLDYNQATMASWSLGNEFYLCRSLSEYQLCFCRILVHVAIINRYNPFINRNHSTHSAVKKEKEKLKVFLERTQNSNGSHQYFIVESAPIYDKSVNGVDKLSRIMEITYQRHPL